MDLPVASFAVLLLLSAIVAMVTRRLKIPYNVGLVAAGAALMLVPSFSSITLSRDLIFLVLLPPLVFEAAFYIDIKELRRNLAVIVTLATVGVVLAACLVGAGMRAFAGWPWGSALVFGMLIAATDPVAVIATFKETGVRGRLRILMEAESLLNDGTAAVGFGIALALAQGGHSTAGDAVVSLIVSLAGALLVGALAALGCLLLLGKTQDHLVEITFTTVAAYGSFLLAEHFHCSGVLAAMTAGLIMGNFGGASITDNGRESVGAFWEYAAFAANSLVFLLMGSRLAQQHMTGMLRPAAIAVALVTLGRAVAVYPSCAAFFRSRQKVEMRHQHVLFWGGLRGALALALALSLPETLPRRDEVVAVAFAVVAFSIFVQGLTIQPLLRKWGQG
jgi:CPA1 family monovalent cation:H+ antiporter